MASSTMVVTSISDGLLGDSLSGDVLEGSIRFSGTSPEELSGTCGVLSWLDNPSVGDGSRQGGMSIHSGNCSMLSSGLSFLVFEFENCRISISWQGQFTGNRNSLEKDIAFSEVIVTIGSRLFHSHGLGFDEHHY